jgi:hypothetical protein
MAFADPTHNRQRIALVLCGEQERGERLEDGHWLFELTDFIGIARSSSVNHAVDPSKQEHGPLSGDRLVVGGQRRPPG